MPRKIAIITGSRADASPLHPVINSLLGRPRDLVEPRIIDTHGLFDVEIQMREALRCNRPDMAVLLGDRYETLVAASVCALLGIPIAHLSGGDETQGAVDNSFRHAITKLSYWHFPGHELHRQRLIQMGEVPEHIFCLGYPAVDNLVNLMSQQECEARLAILLAKSLLVTYHPETLSADDVIYQVSQLIIALDEFREYQIIITGSNADIGGDEATGMLYRYADGRDNVKFSVNYQRRLYNSMINHCSAVVGNSSTGVIEAAVIGTPSVNIGDRQKGRIRLPSVIDVRCKSGEIIDGIYQALAIGMGSGNQFHSALRTDFGTPGLVGERIADALTTLTIPKTTEKAFHAV